LAVLLIDTSCFSQVERQYGSDAYRTVLEMATEVMLESRGTEFRQSDIVTTSDRAGDAFLVFLAPKRSARPWTVADLEATAARIEQDLNRRIAGVAVPFLRSRPRVTVGFSLVLNNPLVMAERLLARLVDEAGERARFQRTSVRFETRSRLQEILINEQITSVYQPIRHLADGSLLGCEALCRGPADTVYHSPAVLFEMAEEADLLFELDRLCRRRALMNARGLPASAKLFVNVLPQAMYDPDFRGRRLSEFLDEQGLRPQQIVFEITEKYVIENYTLFSEAQQDLAEIGFSFAVDDVGAGHSGLEKIAKLNPTYLKFDVHLVRDIHVSYVRREMVAALKAFADKMGSTIIAEGIEREQERQALLALGVEYGQGFWLAQPAPGNAWHALAEPPPLYTMVNPATTGPVR
jgi:EAL domain-containing protein (putative c-di-GMP-specific phosphodiesterase class I)